MSDAITMLGIGVVVGAVIGVFLGVGLYHLIQRSTISIFDLKNKK